MPARPHRTVDRVTGILETVSLSPRGVTLAELADALDAAKSSVQELTNGLLARGYLVEEDGRFHLGPGPFILAARANTLAALSVDHRFVVELNKVLGCNVLVGVRVGDAIVFVDHVGEESPGLTYVARTHARRPLYTSAAGKTLLANVPDEEMYRLLDLARPEQAGEVRQFLAELPEIRATRLAFNRGATFADAFVVATPLLTHDGRLIAAISAAVDAVRSRSSRRPSAKSSRRRLPRSVRNTRLTAPDRAAPGRQSDDVTALLSLGGAGRHRGAVAPCPPASTQQCAPNLNSGGPLPPHGARRPSRGPPMWARNGQRRSGRQRPRDERIGRPAYAVRPGSCAAPPARSSERAARLATTTSVPSSSVERRGPGRGAGREGRRRRSHRRARRAPSRAGRQSGGAAGPTRKCACVDAGLDDQAVDALQAHEQHDDPGEAVHTGERRRDEHRRQAAEDDPQRRDDAEPTDDEAQQERGVEADRPRTPARRSG